MASHLIPVNFEKSSERSFQTPRYETWFLGWDTPPQKKRPGEQKHSTDFILLLAFVCSGGVLHTLGPWWETYGEERESEHEQFLVGRFKEIRYWIVVFEPDLQRQIQEWKGKQSSMSFKSTDSPFVSNFRDPHNSERAIQSKFRLVLWKRSRSQMHEKFMREGNHEKWLF
jgi:hypothetical protein